MRHCYKCDAPITGTGYRRWVETSTVRYNRVYVSRRGLSGGSAGGGTRQEVRTVCQDCADQIDAVQARSNHIRQVFIECILIVVVGFWLVHCIELGYPDHPPAPQPVHQETSTSGEPHG